MADDQVTVPDAEEYVRQAVDMTETFIEYAKAELRRGNFAGAIMHGMAGAVAETIKATVVEVERNRMAGEMYRIMVLHLLDRPDAALGEAAGRG